MRDVDRWWRDDPSIFRLRDVPSAGAETRLANSEREQTVRAENKRTAVADLPLDGGERLQPLNVPQPAAPSPAPPSYRNDAVKRAPASAPMRSRPAQNAGDTLFASMYEPRRASRSRRRTAKLWVALLLETVMLGGVIWYGVLAMRQNNISVSQLPGVDRIVTGVTSRMEATQLSLHDLTNRFKLAGR